MYVVPSSYAEKLQQNSRSLTLRKQARENIIYEKPQKQTKRARWKDSGSVCHDEELNIYFREFLIADV